MIDDLVNAGYHARRSRNGEREVQLFRLWCEQQKIFLSNDINAEISWEKRISELKLKNSPSSFE